MRKQLLLDIKGSMNMDAADTLILLFEAHNQLVTDFNALVDQLEADSTMVTAADEASSATVDID